MRCQSARIVVVLSFLIAILACPIVGQAVYVGTSQNLPPLDGEYVNPQTYYALFANGVILKDVVYKQFTASFPPPPMAPPVLTYTHNFAMRVEGTWSSDNGMTYTSFSAPANVTVRTSNTTTDVGNTRFFDTEMLQLDLSGGTFPAGVMIRESPTIASLGNNTITDVGGGIYHIDSFFDVFTELSTDGGFSWYPSVGQPGHMTLVPEPSSLILLGLGVLGLATMVRSGRNR